MSRERRMRSKRWLTALNIRAPIGVQGRSKMSKSLCSWSIDLLIWVRSWRSCKSLIKSLFCTCFPTSLGEALSGKGLFLQKLKPQAEFSLISSISIAEVISLKAMGKIQAGIKVEWERASIPLCCRERGWQAVPPLRPRGSWVTQLSPSPDYMSCGPIAGNMGCPCKDVTLN